MYTVIYKEIDSLDWKPCISNRVPILTTDLLEASTIKMDLEEIWGDRYEYKIMRLVDLA